MKLKLLLFIALLSAVGLASPAQDTKKPLTKEQIMELVKGSVPSTRLADLVHQRGIDFEPTEEYFRDLRSAGAEPVLIDALGAATPVKPPGQDNAARAKQNLPMASVCSERLRYNYWPWSIKTVTKPTADARTHQVLHGATFSPD